MGCEFVIIVVIEGEVWVYLLCYLMWYEIVNDWFGDVFVVVIFCLLCNLVMVFDCWVGEWELEFGVLGKLCYLDMIMYDC